MIRTMWCAVLFLGTALSAQTFPTTSTAASDTPDQAAVREAARQFWQGVAGGDTAQVTALIAEDATPETRQAVLAFGETSKSMQRFKAAVQSKFNQPLRTGNDMDAAAQVERVNRQQVQVTGDTATVGGELQLRKTGGQWKVSQLAEPRLVKMMLAIMPAAKKMMDDSTTEVEQGKYADLNALQQAMSQKEKEQLRPVMQRAMREMMGATTGPSTRATTQPSTGPTR